jgi:hypothetical protein
MQLLRGRVLLVLSVINILKQFGQNRHQAIIKSLLIWDQTVTDSSPSIRNVRLVDSLIVADRRVRATPELPTRRLRTCA